MSKIVGMEVGSDGDAEILRERAQLSLASSFYFIVGVKKQPVGNVGRTLQIVQDTVD